MQTRPLVTMCCVDSKCAVTAHGLSLKCTKRSNIWI